MRTKASLLFGLALVFGGIAAYLVNQIVSSQMNVPQAETAAEQTQTVVVAAVELPVGANLERSQLKTIELPQEAAPAGGFTSIDEALAGQPSVVNVAISPGEFIMPSRLSTGYSRPGLTTRIPDGFRAVSIPVNAVRGVGGFVLPSDRVDVLHTTAVGRRDDAPVTRTLLQNVTVLGVDQNSSDAEGEPMVVNVVTLLASPEQSKKLTLAQQAGSLTLALRNAGDTIDDTSSTVAFNNLWNLDPEERIRVAADNQPTPTPIRRRSVEVIRGLVVDQQTVSTPEDALASN